MIKKIKYPDGRGRLLVFLLILFGLGVTIYRPALLALFSAVIHRQGSSHGVFIPFLSGYLLWLKLDKIKKLPPQVNWPAGVTALLLGTILFFLSKNSEYSLTFGILSFLCISGGLVLLLFGSAIFKETAFPLFLLATMIPLPPKIYASIADWMREVSTTGSVMVTQALGVPLYREEFNITLPERNLLVAKSCSGMRYLLSYFSFSLVYAALYKQSMVGRLVVVLGSFPLAILGGIMRLSAIFLATHYINPIMAEPRPHILLSWAVFAILLFGVIGIDQYLSKNSGSESQ